MKIVKPSLTPRKRLLKTIDLRGLDACERDERINAAIEKHVCRERLFHANGKHGKAWIGGGCVHSAGGTYVVTDEKAEPTVRDLKSYSTSADAVIPLLGDDWDSRCRNGRYQATLYRPSEQNEGEAATFATAACYALLSSAGFTILT